MIRTRGLSPDEIALLPSGFITHINIARLRLIGRTHNPFAQGKIVARGYDLIAAKVTPVSKDLNLFTPDSGLTLFCHLGEQ